MLFLEAVAVLTTLAIVALARAVIADLDAEDEALAIEAETLPLEELAELPAARAS